MQFAIRFDGQPSHLTSRAHTHVELTWKGCEIGSFRSFLGHERLGVPFHQAVPHRQGVPTRSTGDDQGTDEGVLPVCTLLLIGSPGYPC